MREVKFSWKKKAYRENGFLLVEKELKQHFHDLWVGNFRYVKVNAYNISETSGTYIVIFQQSCPRNRKISLETQKWTPWTLKIYGALRLYHFQGLNLVLTLKTAIKLRIGCFKVVKKDVSLRSPSSRSQNYDLLVSYIIPEALHTGLRRL